MVDERFNHVTVDGDGIACSLLRYFGNYRKLHGMVGSEHGRDVVRAQFEALSGARPAL